MEWKTTADDSNFLVSENGEVKRLNHIHIGTDGRKYIRPERIEKQTLLPNGYFRTRLGPIEKYIHRLVCETFVKNPDPNKFNVVNHLDGNKQNNHYTNLEWTDNAGNMKHASENGLINRTSEKRKKQCPINAKVGGIKNRKQELVGKPILYFNIDGSLIKEFTDIYEAAKELNKRVNHIEVNIQRSNSFRRAPYFKFK